MAFGIGSLAMSDFMQVPSAAYSYPRKAGGPTLAARNIATSTPRNATPLGPPVPLVPMGLIVAGIVLLTSRSRVWVKVTVYAP